MKNKRWIYIIGMLAVLTVLGTLAYRVALQRLKTGIEQALGPRGSVQSLDIGWHAVVLHHLRVQAQPGSWPVEDELRADTVTVVPDVAGLLDGGWRVQSVTVDGAYLSMLRTRSGTLRVLPSMLEAGSNVPPDLPASAVRESPPDVNRGGRDPKADSSPQGPDIAPSSTVRIAQVHLRGATVDFFDASVRRPAHRMRLEQLHADLGPVKAPALDERMHIDLEAVFKGPHEDGQLTLNGDLTPSTREAHLRSQLRHADLIALQPYLLRFNEGGVRSGVLDLTLEATVENKRLHAPGQIVLSGLQLNSASGTMGSFAGVPRQAIIAAMSRKGRIELHFTLDGSLDDPRFSLNEMIAQRWAVGLADTLGVSVKGVVEGVGGVLKGLFGR